MRDCYLFRNNVREIFLEMVNTQSKLSNNVLSATRRSSYPGSVRTCTVYGYCTRKLVLMSACFDNMLRIMYGYIYCRN